MPSDPFSDIIRLTNAQSVISGGFTAGEPWSIQFPAPDKIKFFAIVKGHCWLSLEGEKEPVHAEEGDVFLLTAQRSFILASDLAVPPQDATVLFKDRTNKVIQVGEGDDCRQIGGHIRLDPMSGNLLADALPPLLHVRAAAPQSSVMRWLLNQLVSEGTAQLPGAQVASAQIAQLLFVQLLRAYLEEASSYKTGWLRALSDERIAPVLHLMHGDPGRAWQLKELARAVAMSRTTFATHFKMVAGVPPLTYLLNWRMSLAERALREDDTPISALALSLGYTSESAFSNAFKRTMGMAPKRYRDAMRGNEKMVAEPDYALA